MSKIIPKETWVYDSTPAIDPVTFNEFLRRKNALQAERNPLNNTIQYRSLKIAIDNGKIKVIDSGGDYFLDWGKEKNRNMIFRTSYRTDKRKKKAVSRQ